MPFKDPEKRRAYRRKWYSENKKSEITHVRRRKNSIKLWLWEYKSSLVCKKCGEKHPAIIDFHHNQGGKEKSISNMVLDGYSIARIKREINKCIILCSNCHRKIHFSKELKNKTFKMPFNDI